MLKIFSTQTMVARLFQLGLALIPAFEGLLAVVNDIEGAKSTLQSVIIPLFSMQTVQPEFIDSWRAIHASGLQIFAYFFLVGFEGLVGVFAIIGLIKMLKNFTHDHIVFIQAQTWVRAACMLGILIWGFGFFVMGSDFFLAWQSSAAALGGFQTGGLDYALMMFIPYLLFKHFEYSRTI